MNPPTEIVPLGQRAARALDVPALKQDLVSLWREEGAATKEGSVVRACHSTLVVPVGANDDVEDLLLDIVQILPSRVIVVRAEPERATGDVEAWVSASCTRRPGGGSLVCSEAIHMAAGPGSDARVTSAVRSLAVGGLPVVVLAETQSPLEVGWVSTVDRTADVVLGNSENLATADGIRLWERAMEDNGGVRYVDILWARLIDWRRAVAFWFDRPGEENALRSIERVSVEVASDPGGLLKGWLFAGWLGARLGWEVLSTETGGQRARMRSPDGEVDLQIRPVRVEGEPSLISTLTLEFLGAREPLCWERLSRERAIEVLQGRQRTPLFRLNQTKTRRATAVVDLIRENRPDPVARDAMTFAVELGRGSAG